jgi:hypothetical protein
MSYEFRCNCLGLEKTSHCSEAKAKLDCMNHSAQPSKKQESKSENNLSEKQIKFLAGKLSHIPDFGKYAVGNESHEQLAIRLDLSRRAGEIYEQ